MHHDLKIESQYFDQDKPFEIRFNDRGVSEGGYSYAERIYQKVSKFSGNADFS